MPNEILPNNPAAWGTWTQMGWRVGPPVPLPSDVDDVPRLNLNQNGYGAPQSCVHAHNVVLTANAVGNATVCPELDTVEASTWLPLAATGQNSNSYAQSYYGVPANTVPFGGSPSDTPPQKQGNQYLGVQLLFPTCLIYYSNDTTLPEGATLDITAFGYDAYNQPLQEYMTLTNEAPVAVGLKAFSGITGVWVGDGTGDVVFPALLSIGTAAQWGFPYAVYDASQILSVTATAETPTGTVGRGGEDDVLDGPDVRGTFGFGLELPEGATINAVVGTQYVAAASPDTARREAFCLGSNLGGLTFTTADLVGTYSSTSMYGQRPTYYGYPVDPNA